MHLYHKQQQHCSLLGDFNGRFTSLNEMGNAFHCSTVCSSIIQIPLSPYTTTKFRSLNRVKPSAFSIVHFHSINRKFVDIIDICLPCKQTMNYKKFFVELRVPPQIGLHDYVYEQNGIQFSLSEISSQILKLFSLWL